MTLPDFLTRDATGEIRLSGHRIGLFHLVHYYEEGYSAEMLAGQYPTLPLALIYKVIAFYLENKADIDAYVSAVRAELDQQRAANPEQLPLATLRQRLERMRQVDKPRTMLRFLLDEHLRGPLWSALVRHNAIGGLPIDATRVGDEPDLPLGSDDPAILLWAERAGRILLREDVHTMPGYLVGHLHAGQQSPGVFVISRGSSIKEVVRYLELAAHAGEPADYADTITHLP